MVSYFGTSAKVKKMKIPLWVVGLIGDPSDLDWAITNAMAIDEEDFQKFRHATLRSVISYVFYRNGRTNSSFELGTSGENWNKKNSVLTEARTVCHKAETVEEIELMLARCVNLNFEDEFWNEVVNSDWNLSKSKYVVHVRNIINTTVSDRANLLVKKFVKPKHINPDTYFDVPTGMSGTERFAFLCTGRMNVYDALLEYTLANIPQEKSPLMITKVSEEGKEPPSYHASLNLSSSKQIIKILVSLNAETAFDSVLNSGVVASIEEAFGDINITDASRIDTVSASDRARILRRANRISSETAFAGGDVDDGDDNDDDDSDDDI